MNTYADQLDRLERIIVRLDGRIAQLSARSRRFSNLRMLLFLLGVAACYFAFRFGGLAGGIPSTAAAIGLFAVAAALHARIERGRMRHEAWRSIKRAQRARMQLDWESIPEPPGLVVPADHPFAFDLDLVGPRSAHHLLDVTSTVQGSVRLASLLTETTPDHERALRRQRIVRELLPLARLRERLMLATRMASGGERHTRDMRRLTEWLEKTPSLERARRAVLWGTIAWALAMGGFWYVVVALQSPYALLFVIAYRVFSSTGLSISDHTLDETLTVQSELAPFANAFILLENHRYDPDGLLGRVCAPFHDAATRPSRQVGRVAGLVAWISLKKNWLLWMLLNVAAPVERIVAYRLIRCRHDLRVGLPKWIEAWTEVEAHAALANLGWLFPHFTFPVLEPAADRDRPVIDTKLFEAQGLGHPLIAEDRVVRNDVSFGALGDIMLITGSNMAGKSTFLRSIGVNLALAYAGAPVDARAMSTVMFRCFTSIRISDSLSDGFSFFYAEVRRLRALLDAVDRTDDIPVFFLIDEVFRGTNNRERLIGARAIIQALAARSATGAIATHDLELVALADEMPSIANYHFRDTVVAGTMHFDYKLHHGPCPTTNALVIMRLAGLPVEPAAAAEPAATVEPAATATGTESSAAPNP